MDMFCTKSDLDVSINFGNGTSELPREKKLQILKRFAKKLRSLEGQGHVRNVESIFSARMPIVKFSDKGTAIECDLSVENKYGILNSQVIRIISQIDDRFQKLCMLVKHWAKAHEVNSALHRTLNSVSITLLVALHLQTQNPPILPPFSMLFKDGIDPPKVEKRMQKFLNWGQPNQESLGRLFATFFIKLQSVEFLWRQGLCVSVLNGLWISKKWKKVGVGSISVEDFTDVSENVTRRVNGKGVKKIYSSINRTVKDIFEFLNDKVAGTDLRHRLFGQQVVAQPPLLAPLNGKTAGIHRVFGQQAVVEPRPPVLPLNGKIAGTHLKHSLFGQQAVVKPPPSAPSLNGKITEAHRKHRLFGQQAVVERPPHVLPLNVYPQQPHHNYRNEFNGRPEEFHNKRIWLENGYRAVGGTSHGREEIFENPRGKRNRYAGNWNDFEEFHETPPVLSLNGIIAGTHLKHRLFDQQAVVELPHMMPLNAYPQQPHNNYRNEFNGLAEEQYNKRVCLENGYRAVGGTSHGREEIYENPRGIRNRFTGNWNGFEEFHEIPRFEIHNKPVDDRYRHDGGNGHLVHHRHDGRFSSEEPMPVGLWHDYSRRFDLPLPPPQPYERVSYGNFGPGNSAQPYFSRRFY